MDTGWHPDPSSQHELRYWDGARWTEHVVDRGVQSVSPLPDVVPVLPPQGQVPVGQGPAAQPAQALPAQAPPSQPAAQSPPAAQRAPAHAQGFPQGQPPQGQPPQGFPPAGAPQGLPGGGPGGIRGELVDGRFAGVEANGPSLQNPKLLRVRLTEPFLAKQGAMVAYQGDLQFHYQGAGMGRVLKRALTGEGLALMRVEGRGDCFLADTAKTVHLLHLENSGISVNGSNVLAFSQSLEWNVERVKGAAMATGGLFNTTLRGTGWLAIVTDGDPVVLDAGVAPTFADTDAIVAWSADLQTSLHSTMSAGALIGRGSGEAVQVVFQGRGFVIVQPSETVKLPGK